MGAFSRSFGKILGDLMNLVKEYPPVSPKPDMPYPYPTPFEKKMNDVSSSLLYLYWHGILC